MYGSALQKDKQSEESGEEWYQQKIRRAHINEECRTIHFLDKCLDQGPHIKTAGEKKTRTVTEKLTLSFLVFFYPRRKDEHKLEAGDWLRNGRKRRQ